MMRLYQWDASYQCHYVVATDYGDAEETIKAKYGWATDIKKLTCLGPYVQISKKVLGEGGGEGGD